VNINTTRISSGSIILLAIAGTSIASILNPILFNGEDLNTPKSPYIQQNYISSPGIRELNFSYNSSTAALCSKS